jgi:hypothetical protein
MPRIRLIRLVAATVVGLVALGCADYATAPSGALRPASSAVLYRGFATPARVRAVHWAGRGGANLQASGIIGPDGGSLSIPGADFTIVFPRGALGKATAITIIANSDGYVGYEMLPHGLTFARPVIATQGLNRAAQSAGVFCAYLAPGEGVGADGFASASEIETSTTNYGSSVAGGLVQVWTLHHFSRYILASGATSDPSGSPDGN